MPAELTYGRLTRKRPKRWLRTRRSGRTPSRRCSPHARSSNGLWPKARPRARNQRGPLRVVRGAGTAWQSSRCQCCAISSEGSPSSWTRIDGTVDSGLAVCIIDHTSRLKIRSCHQNHPSAPIQPRCYGGMPQLPRQCQGRIHASSCLLPWLPAFGVAPPTLSGQSNTPPGKNAACNTAETLRNADLSNLSLQQLMTVTR